MEKVVPGDFIVVFAALGAIGAYAGGCWLVASSAPAINRVLERSDRVLTGPVSIAVVAAAAIPLVIGIVNFFLAVPR